MKLPSALWRCLLIAFAAACVGWCVSPASAIGFYLSETKEQLKLAYDVVVNDHGDGRVSIEFILADEGRLKPLDEVQFSVPCKQKNPDGSHYYDLVVSLLMRKGQDGKSHAYIQVTKDFAERGEIVLNTHSMDGKPDPMTRLHHSIPVRQFMAKPAPADKPAAAPGACEPAQPAATGKK